MADIIKKTPDYKSRFAVEANRKRLLVKEK